MPSSLHQRRALRSRPGRWQRCACALALLPVAALAQNQAGPAEASAANTAAQAQPLPQEQTVIVRGNYLNAVGSSDAASQGVVTSRLIESRPTLRPAEVLEFVPGLIVTQHSGDGKANQYFLRGFNLDHGTDFASYVDGMPVNMPTHAHGQGYSDLNWLIPELVDRISYRKGPYFAEEGDFASAGAARIRLADSLPRGVADLTLGEHGYRRGLVANSSTVGSGALLYALEATHNDGPWDNPERFGRVNGVLRYSLRDGATRQSLTAMAYSARWNATDQIPQRAVDSGLIGRFGTLDSSDGGSTARSSLSYALQRDLADGALHVNAYAIRSRLTLFSNFTYFLDNPENGDQFEQAERRTVAGLAASRRWDGTLWGHETSTTLGLQARQDRLAPVGLYSTVARQRLSTTAESRVRQTSAGLYAENNTRWTPWLRSVLGLRTDSYSFHVDASDPQNSGRRNAGITSPKLSLVLGPWAKTEFFVNAGNGFHSNDARGTTAAVDPVNPLVRSTGSELGVRTDIVPGLQSSLALWQLKLGSELVFVGDAGTTEPNRASKRHGVEWNNHLIATPWLLFDLDVAASQARFTEPDASDPTIGNSVPGSIDRVVSLGATVTDLGPWFGQFQLRYFGPRPLVEDNSQRSRATTLAYLRAGYKFTPSLRLALDVFNLFDRKSSDIDYFYTSRLRGEPAGGVDGIQFHPVEPRSLRLSLVANF